MEAARSDEIIRAGRLEIRPDDALVLAAGRPLNLSVREYGVLLALSTRAPRIVSREELSTSVWEHPLRAGERSVGVYVHKVRVQVERALPDTRVVHTHVGFGYRFAAEPSHGFHTDTTTR